MLKCAPSMVQIAAKPHRQGAVQQEWF